MLGVRWVKETYLEHTVALCDNLIFVVKCLFGDAVTQAFQARYFKAGTLNDVLTRERERLVILRHLFFQPEPVELLLGLPVVTVLDE